MVRERLLSAVLSEFARTMITDFPIQRILDRLVERIVEVLPVTGAGVTLISPGVPPRYVAASSDEALRFETLQTALGEGPCLLTYYAGHAVAIADLAADSQFPRFAQAAVPQGLAAVFTFPLRHGSGRLGSLDLYRDVVGGLDADDLEVAQTLADVAAAYLINAQARQDASETSARFEADALRDVLTGLPNRRLLGERLDHSASQASRADAAAAVLFVDLDEFKTVNDTHGHEMGDTVLIAVARRLSGLVRPGDTLARLSGDEFVFLCENLATVDAAEMLADRVRDAFATAFICDGVEILLSASVGVAYAGAGTLVASTLIREADLAMYREKNARAAKPPEVHSLDLTRPIPATKRG